MSTPLVSVIIPTYNCGQYVRAAIESVLAQDYAALEVVVVDDGSKDDTLSVLATFGDRIRVYSQANSGPAAARNRAVRESRGEYLAFLDGDDLWLPGQPGALMTYVDKHPGTHVIYGQWSEWHAAEDGTYPALSPHAAVNDPGIDPDLSGWVYPKLLFDSIIHIIAAVVHRSVYDAVNGFDESLRTGSDYDFWLRVSRRYPVVKLRYPVAVYRQNPASVTNTIRRENNAYRLLRRAIDTYGLADSAGHVVDPRAARRRLGELAFTHGYRHFWGGDPMIALRSFAQSLRHRPLHLKSTAYVIAALARRWGLFDPARKRGDAN
jgi:glycosyltransferase involved in cell wall biosynthesis